MCGGAHFPQALEGGAEIAAYAAGLVIDKRSNDILGFNDAVVRSGVIARKVQTIEFKGKTWQYHIRHPARKAFQPPGRTGVNHGERVTGR